MTRKTKRNILIGILLIIAVAASIGYYKYNLGPMDVKSTTATKITAIELYKLFSTDSTRAIKNYAGTVLEVKGQVTGSSFNQQKERIILLKTGADGASINCTMEEDPGSLTINDEITIKGICSGIGQADEDLGIKADVYLTRSFLIK